MVPLSAEARPPAVGVEAAEGGATAEGRAADAAAEDAELGVEWAGHLNRCQP